VQPNFWRYYLYFLPDQAETLLDHFNILMNSDAKFQLDLTTDKEFPHWLTFEKIGSFYNVAKSSQFLQWGSMGKIFNLCLI